MRALPRKLLRDLWQVKGQAVAIALVIAAGMAMFVTYLSTLESLSLTRAAFYDRYRFADVFASLKRAPDRLRAEIAALPGVARVETRVVADVTLDVAGLEEPAVGRLISVPVPGSGKRTPILDDLFLRRGRWIEPHRPDEVLASEAFTLAHGLHPGDRVTAIINGRRRDLTVVGIVLSPEYVYSIRPGEIFPDDRLFGIFWMERKALASAFDMQGGFNDVALKLSPEASEEEVRARLDRLLARYGGLGSIPRSLQVSNWYLDNEMKEMRTMGLILPSIFLAVAAFLLNVVLSRIVAVQREQIAALKALGYNHREIGLHYLAWGLAVAVLGTVVGIAAGAALGHALTGLYSQYFRFPSFRYRLPPAVAAGALAVAFAAAVLGVYAAVRRAVSLPPAEAMRPEPPASYRRSAVERLGLGGLLSPAARMVVRNLERRPGRALASVVGIAFAAAMLVVGLFSLDAIDRMLEVQFEVAQRQDATVTFVEPRSASALAEVRHLPGVLYAEPLRTVAARLRFGSRSRQVAIQGLRARARLNRVVDTSLRPVELPPDGLVLSTKLAELLAVRPGDTLVVEVLEGRRPVLRIPVVARVEEYLGTSAYMEIGALRSALHEGRTLSGAFLATDAAERDRLYHRLKSTPAVAAVSLKESALASFRETLDQTLGILILFNVLFAGIIAVGVVYNAARVSLSERARELASLRVMGFTRGEISSILLGELALVTLVGVPLGLLLGYGLAALVTAALNTELYRFPLVVLPRTYAFAAAVVVAASAMSALAVRRRLDHLDLVAVLKTPE